MRLLFAGAVVLLAMAGFDKSVSYWVSTRSIVVGRGEKRF